jgi:catechol 2,3-dioxygenase-like lactoylglutathione lyase family enzyme
MEPRISFVTLGVDDLERSTRFYAEGLGLPQLASPAFPGSRWRTTSVPQQKRTGSWARRWLREGASSVRPGTPTGADTPGTSPIPMASSGKSRGIRNSLMSRYALPLGVPEVKV